jgi:hypothetical protein
MSEDKDLDLYQASSLAARHAKRVAAVRYEIRDDEKFEYHVACEVAVAILTYQHRSILRRIHAASPKVVLLGWALGAIICVAAGLLAPSWPRAVAMTFMALGGWLVMSWTLRLAAWVTAERYDDDAGVDVAQAAGASIIGQEQSK